jgi:UDP-N-acetylmuramoyl-L-alanyl-D-glutamate--2,6-diaminopimelate ligase
MLIFTTAKEAAAWLQTRLQVSLSEQDQMQAQLHSDSRRVKAGDAFLAYPGETSDGRRYAAPALAAGACACLMDVSSPETTLEQLDWIQLQLDPNDDRLACFVNLKDARAEIAALFYGTANADLKLMAVTGTNGKTTTSWWLAQALAHLGERAAVAGTLGVGELVWNPLSHTMELKSLALNQKSPKETGDLGLLTTPEATQLHSALRTCVRKGVRYMSMEASSIGLVEGRMKGLQIEVAVLTNFTQDHLDYHHTLERYWSAKASLFLDFAPKAAVINLDDPKGLELYAELELRRKSVESLHEVKVVGYTVRKSLPSELEPGVLCAHGIRLDEKGQAFEISWANERKSASIQALGAYNLSNALAVMGSLLVMGRSLDEAIQAVGDLKSVPGRMQVLDVEFSDSMPLVVVDYAHTPDALQQVLSALVEKANARNGALWCIFGCGGDRDAIKRPLMGGIAQAWARHVIVTSDNPRSEDALSIAKDVLSGVKKPSSVELELDRQQAIESAIQRAQPQDVVLVAGKGHEQTQEVKGVKTPFSDAKVARQALEKRIESQSSKKGGHHG